MFAIGISDSGFARLAQVLQPWTRTGPAHIEIFWDEDDDPRAGGWVWRFSGVEGIVHPLDGEHAKNPAAEDEDLEFLATLDPEFPEGQVDIIVDRDNTPIFGSW